MCLVCIKTTLELGFESNKSLMHLHQVEKTAVIMNTTLIHDQTWLKGKVNLYAASKDIFLLFKCVWIYTLWSSGDQNLSEEQTEVMN